jgi:hypothetical protein
MKNYRLPLIIAMLLLFAVGTLSAQKATRPKATGNGTIDGYVTESFDLNDKVVAQKELLVTLDKAIIDAKAAGNGKISAPDADKLLAQLEGLQKEIASTEENIKTLAGKFDGIRSEAKGLSPTKAPAALKAVDAANDINKLSASDIRNLALGAAESIKQIQAARG